MKVSRKLLILLVSFVLLFCTACTDKQPVSENNDKEETAKEETEVEEQTEPKEETRKAEQSVEKEIEEVKPIQLNNTYETKYGDFNAVTYPKFYFDYPDNWQVSTEEVSTTNERVVLSNERGATVGNIEIPWRDKLYHFLIVGRTGSGKTELTKQIMYLLKRQNVRVVYCDPKNSIDMHWFCKQYDIRYFSTENDIAKTVREFEESMLHREQDLKNMNLEQAPFNEEFLVFDELLAYGKNASKKNFEEVSRRIGSLVLQGRGKQCYVCLITQRADINDKTILDGATRDNLFVRIQMGNGSETSNKMVFGSEFAHVKNYRTEKGSGLIYREGIDSKPRELLVPYLKTE